MTKQLLTALLIAGVSATAKAEQWQQWLCKGDEIVTWASEEFRYNPEIKPVTFVLEISRKVGQEFIEIKGNGSGLIVNDPFYAGGSVQFDVDYYMRASNHEQTVSLSRDGKLVMTDTSYQVLVRVIFAECDKL